MGGWVGLPFASIEGRAICLSAGDAVVVAADPRRLFVAVRSTAIRVDILVAHAPCTSRNHTPAEIAEWWRNTSRLVQRCGEQRTPLVASCDANARLGSATSEHVGEWAAHQQDQPGEAFHEFLAERKLFLPSTFPDTATGAASNTWFSEGTRGPRSRGPGFVCVMDLWYSRGAGP